MQTEILTNQMTIIETVRKISYCKAINFKEIEPTLKKSSKKYIKFVIYNINF